MSATRAAVDPLGAEAVTDAVGRWLAERFDGVVRRADHPTSAGDGYDTRVHFARYAGDSLPEAWCGPLVLRVHPTADRTELARREAAAADWCADLGYPAPRVLVVFGAGELLDVPVQVMERAPGVPMVAAAMARPWRSAEMIDELAGLHLELHSLPIAGFPNRDGPSLAVRRLQPVHRWIDELPPADAEPLRDALDRLGPLLAWLDAPDTEVVCHGDFHPLNVLWAGPGRATVIDWTDVAVGDRHGDVARTALLFEVASVAASSAVERRVLRAAGGWMRSRYLDGYGAGYVLDAERLLRWQSVHLLHGWGQVVALHAGLFPNATSARGAVPSSLAPWLRARFEASLG